MASFNKKINPEKLKRKCESGEEKYGYIRASESGEQCDDGSAFSFFEGQRNRCLLLLRHR